MIGVSSVAQEAAFWVFLIACVIGLIGGLWRLASKANHIIDTTENSAEKLTTVEAKVDATADQLAEHQRYSRFHWGPNGEATPMHRRVRRLEEALGLHVDD